MKMMWTLKALVFFVFYAVTGKETLHYDTFTGSPIFQQLVAILKASDHSICTIEIKSCDTNEWRRVDGTCNNLKYPSRGARYTPFYRILSANYTNINQPRKAKTGRRLPPSRKTRTHMLSVGPSRSAIFTALVPIFWEFVLRDSLSVDDTLNFLLSDYPCCLPKGLKANKMCMKIEIPPNDPVHRFSEITCMNNSYPHTFQSYGCLGKKVTPAKIDPATPLIDLSSVYGNTIMALNSKGRLFKYGLLKYEEPNIAEGQIWPPVTRNRYPYCFNNRPPQETRCHDVPDPTQNFYLGQNMGLIWYWRQHNFLAQDLYRINPCWDDERLFQTARDINIAMYQQVYYYELLPGLFGPDNMIRDEIISDDQGFRDVYDANEMPQLCLECIYAQRWLLTIQPGSLKLHNKNGTYIKQFPFVETIARTGLISSQYEFLSHTTNGLFRSAGGKCDHEVDYDFADKALPGQDMYDEFTSDIVQTRHLGFQPYVKYLKYCTGKTFKSFKDLVQVMDIERTFQLQLVYENVEDIDLIVGIWMERVIPNGFVPSTLYCLMTNQLKRNVKSDRHWFEREHRPHSFTKVQLAEIRKASVANLLCTVGDVEYIQPYPFLLPGRGNRIGHCDKSTQSINMNVFKDPECLPMKNYRHRPNADYT